MVLVRSGVELDPRRPVQVLGRSRCHGDGWPRSARPPVSAWPYSSAAAVAREAGRRTAASPRGDRARGRPARTPAQLVHVPAGNLTVQIILLSSSFSDLRVGGVGRSQPATNTVGGIVAAMASLVIERGELVVRLSQLEQLAAQRGDVRVPLSTVRQIRAENCPYTLLRGICRPGTGSAAQARLRGAAVDRRSAGFRRSARPGTRGPCRPRRRGAVRAAARDRHRSRAGRGGARAGRRTGAR